MESKVCSRCKQEKSVGEFYIHKRDGYQAHCKACQKIVNKEYSTKYQAEGYYRNRSKTYGQIPEVKALKHAREKRYRDDPIKRLKSLTRWFTNHEIRAGRLTRKPCTLCSAEKAHAHHPDYNQPSLVVWLCHECHRQVHSQDAQLKKEFLGE